MRPRRSRFGWAAVAAAFIGGHLLPIGAATPALAQSGPDQGAVAYLPVPRSWVTRWYARGDYVAFWTTGNHLPALLTTCPVDTPVANVGVLGESTTQILYGGDHYQDDAQQGGRLTFGYWLDDAHTRAVEAQFWMIGIAEGMQWASAGDPILARPFFNTENGLEDAQIVAYPGLQGAVFTDARSETYSVEALARYNWLTGSAGFLDVFWGYRYFRLRESLSIDEAFASTAQAFDDFDAQNDFHGADLGATLGLRRGAWLLDVTTKVALGDMGETLRVQGSTIIDGSPPTILSGGWLAAPSNIGRHTDHEFAAIPELGIRLAYVAFDIIELSVGYNLVLVSSVLRTGDQIDRTVNPSQLAGFPLARGGGSPSGASRPAAQLDDSTMWMHGISFGMELRW